MRKILIIALLLIGNILFAQDFSYEIKVKDINDLDKSKLVIDCMRGSLKINPTFDINDKVFKINSNFFIKKEDFEVILDKCNYTLVTYSSVLRTTKKENLEE